MSSVLVPARHMQSPVCWWPCGLPMEPRLLLMATSAVLRASPFLCVTMPPSWLSGAQGITGLFLDSLLEDPPATRLHPTPTSQPRPVFLLHWPVGGLPEATRDVTLSRAEGRSPPSAWSLPSRTARPPLSPASLFGTTPARASCSCILARAFFLSVTWRCPQAPVPAQGSLGCPGHSAPSVLQRVGAVPGEWSQHTSALSPESLSWGTSPVTNGHVELEMPPALLKWFADLNLFNPQNNCYGLNVCVLFESNPHLGRVRFGKWGLGRLIEVR